MAIRFQNDAAAVVIPPNQSSRKYGQQLVLQQQKYANDQRQLQQENMYDRQKEYRQTAFQLQKAQTDRFVDAQRMKDQQAFAEKMQQNSLDAQDKRAQQEAQLRARQQEMQRIEQLKKQQQADDFDGINSGEFDGKTASEIKALWREKNAIPADDSLDEAMKAENFAKVEERLKALRGNRIQAPSGAERLNKGVKWKDPSTGLYHEPDREKFPDGKPAGWLEYDENTRSLEKPNQGLPATYEEYKDTDYQRHQKALDAKIGEYRDKALGPGGKKYADMSDQELEDTAYAELKGKYERDRARSNAAKNPPAAPGPQAAPGQPAMPPQAGQPAMPPAQAPAAPPPAMGMQDLEPAYNADGTTSVPGQPAMPPQAGQPLMPPVNQSEQLAAPVQAQQTGQPASQPELIYNDGIGGNGKVYERMPDGSVREFKDAAKQPIQQADGSLWQQSPEDGAWRVVPPTIQPFRPEQPVLPSRPLQPGEEEGGSSFAPRAPGGMQQPAETLPVDQTGMQPPSQNVWSEVGVPGQQPTTPAASKPAVNAPDFAKLSKNAANDTDRVVLGKMQDAYKNAKTPEIQDAIKVLVTPGVPASKKALAARALRAAGIDLNKLIPSANADASGLDFSSAGVM